MNLNELDHISQFIFRVFPELDTEHILSFEELEHILIQDKKNKGNSMSFSLLNNIGDCSYNIDVSPSEIQASLDYLSELYSNKT